LQNQITEQCRLARPAFADGVKMLAAILVRENNGQLLPPMFAYADNNVLVVHTQASLYSEKNRKASSDAREKSKRHALFSSRKGNRGSLGDRKKTAKWPTAPLYRAEKILKIASRQKRNFHKKFPTRPWVNPWVVA
jgi:hypothetical protein